MASDPSAPDLPYWSSRFVSALVHELRTPLASLLLTAEMLAGDDKLDARQARYARTLFEAGRDLRALIDDLGELNRLRARRLQLTPVAVELEELLPAVASGSATTLHAAGARLVVVPPPPLSSPLVADRARLERALRELVGAAAAAGARRIELRAEVAGAARLRLIVSDDGDAPGPAELDALFEPFAINHARLRRAHGGSGLGLPLAAAIARLLGGELAAATGDGTTALRLELPLAVGSERS